ncbi:MAG: ferrous iron transport protein B [Puniceicoccales bacterium]|nr:ferrous iron transport protein B [Puniceicoccales bacterium]
MSTQRLPLVALIGNPNTGKSTLFNALTGLRQRIGNYPGVTVAKKSGFLVLPGFGRIEIIDLPGMYSLSATSLDERIVLDALCGRLGGVPRPDAIVCVADASNLLRNLFLASQVAELGLPMMLVLNQADIASKHGMEMDTAKISARLGGIPVVAVSAWHGTGLPMLRTGMAELLQKQPCMERLAWHPCVHEALALLRDGLRRGGVAAPIPDVELQRLLFDSAGHLADGVRGHLNENVSLDALVRGARELVRHAGFNPLAAEPLLHYERMRRVLDGAVSVHPPMDTFSKWLDGILLNRVFGTAIFFVAMVIVFASVFHLASFPQGWMEGFFSLAKKHTGVWLKDWPVLQSLVGNGIIDGVGAFLGFLPQILILFFFIALLEGTGYMARAAFLMDKLFSWCGLNGKSFVPMLSGYACSVPSVLSTRTIEDPKARLATIFIIPFMSCSARLPVYSLMISAFLVPQIGSVGGTLVLVGMYFVGLFVALPLAWLLTRHVLKVGRQPFLLVLPRYQTPKARDVLWSIWQAGLEFVKRAGTIIFAITVIVWALLYFPHNEATTQRARSEFVAEQAALSGQTPAQVEAAIEASALGQEPGPLSVALEGRVEAAHIEDSYLGRFGRFVQPIFAPAGFDWKITVGILASFPAREVIVSTLSTTYSLGGDAGADSGTLHSAMSKSTWADGARAGRPIFTIPVVLGIMFFFALCSQCGATLSVIVREAGLRWAVASFLCMSFLAWLAAVFCFQIGSLFF